MSKGPFAQFKMDSQREKNGIWIDLGDAGEYLVARAGGSNKDYDKELAELTKPHRIAIQHDSMDDDAALDLMMQAFAKHILRDWKGVVKEDGEELPFSVENALWLFRQLPELFHALREEAYKPAMFRAALREEAAGN